MKNKEGVSEIIGTIILLAIAIVTFSVFAIYVLSNNNPSLSPDLNLVGYMNEKQCIVIEHKGGEELELEKAKIVIWKGKMDSYEYNFDKNGNVMGVGAYFKDMNKNKRWDVGDYIEINASSIFGNIEHWQISVVVIDKESNSIVMSGILKRGILSLSPPVAIFTYAPWKPKTQDIVVFNATQSYDPDGGNINRYEWDFENDGKIDATGAVVVHRYYQPGNYTVKLIVTDDEGQKGIAIAGTGWNTPPVVNVTNNLPPVANFTWIIDINIDGKVDFYANATDPDGEIISYTWYFGDGSTSSSPNPSHIYDRSGNYTVTLIVEDNNGAIHVISKTITIPNMKPIPVFIYNPSNPNTKQYVFFDASSSFDKDGYITNYSWDFENDGIIDAYGVNVYHMFPTAGNYTIKLIVIDNGGKSNSTTKLLQIVEPITAAKFIIVDNTPKAPRNYDGISRILAAVQKLTSQYSTGKAIDSWQFVGGTEQGKNITDTLLDEFDIVIWSTGDFPGDGAPAINDGNPNTWSTSMTEGYDDTSNHVFEITEHMQHNGTLLLCGTYAARDLQEYYGNGVNQDEIDFGLTLGLYYRDTTADLSYYYLPQDPNNGGLDETLHEGVIASFATDYYQNSGSFDCGPIYAKGTINGIIGTSSGGANIVITQDIPLYSLIKQNDNLFQYSLYASGGTPFYDGFEDGDLNEWTISYYQGNYPWRVSNRYKYSPPAGGGYWVFHPDPFYGWYQNPSGAYATGYYAYGYNGDWLISPQITVPSGGRLEFYAGSYWKWSQASFNVKLSTNGNTPSDFNILLGSETNIPRIREHGWTKFTYDLSQYSGQQVYIAIQCVNGLLFVDNFRVLPSGIPTGYYAIDAVRGANRSIILGFDLNSPYITNESREAYIRNAVNWLAEGLGYATVVYVDNDAPPDWYDERHLHTIQEGINAVTLGGKVYVYDGNPYSPAIVNKSVDIIGINNPVIKANSEYGFKVTVDWVTIDGFVIQGENSQNGILLYESSCDTIKNCTIYGFEKGISAIKSHRNTIEKNDIQSNYYGIYIYYGLDNTINDNTIENNHVGIYADSVFLNKIQNNNITYNYADGLYIDSSENNTIWNNFIVNNGGNGIYLLKSTNENTILENIIANNTNGIYLNISTKNLIIANYIYENRQNGIHVTWYSSQTFVMNNEIWNNIIGICMENSSSNELHGNRIYWNGKGIKLCFGAGNIITHNNIYENIEEAIYGIESSNGNRIENNTIYSNEDGISLNGVKGNEILFNYIYSINNTAIYLSNSYPGSYGNNIISRNVIRNSSNGIILKNSMGNTISFNSLVNISSITLHIKGLSNENTLRSNYIAKSMYGIWIERSYYNTILNNTIYSISEHGILLNSYSSQNKIMNNTINDSKNGIHLEYSNINYLLNNTIFYNNENGIYLFYSDSNYIENNTIYNNDDDGIFLIISDKNLIIENKIYDNINGIQLLSSGGWGNIIACNEIFENTRHGICLEKSRAATAGNNEMRQNEIYNNGGDGIYLNSSNINSIQQNLIYFNLNGIFLNSSNSNTIQGNEIYLNTFNGLSLHLSNNNDVDGNNISFNEESGIYILQSSQGDSLPIENNLIWNNSYGLYINSSNYNYFMHNIVWNNSYGIYITFSSTNNEIYENNITTNNYGIYIATSDCTANKIFYNNFINNSLHNDSQAFDMGNNSWYESTSGNYWSEHTSTDPYTIPPGINQDKYPLLSPREWWV